MIMADHDLGNNWQIKAFTDFAQKYVDVKFDGNRL